MDKGFELSSDNLFFDKEKESDITFYVSDTLIKDEWIFLAHSYVIYESSSVFKNMIDSRKQAIKNTTKQNIDIHVECLPEIFNLILIYLYKNEVKISSVSKCLCLLKASIKFQLNDLTFICLDFLYEKISSFNLIDILNNLYELISLGNLSFTESFCENVDVKNFLNNKSDIYSKSQKSPVENFNSFEEKNLYPKLNETLNKNLNCFKYSKQENPKLPFEPISLLNNIHSFEQKKNNFNSLINKIFLKCFNILDENADSILNSDIVNNIDYSLLVDILSRDTLNITSELTTFNMVEKWSNQACLKSNKKITNENKRFFASKALYLVRYLNMSREEFLIGPYVSDILNDEEKLILLNSLNYGYLNYESLFNENQKSNKSFFKESKINLDNFNYQNYDLQWLFLEYKMNVKRKYLKPCHSYKKNNLLNNNVSQRFDDENNKQYLNKTKKFKNKSKTKKVLNGVCEFFVRLIQLIE